MAVQYYNGQYYDVYSPASPMLIGQDIRAIAPQLGEGYGMVQGVGNYAKALTPPPASNQQSSNTGANMYGDPFGTAMSGGQKGTLQPYINRMTQNASNALYGGLMDYKPQSMVAGNAGGSPANSKVPNWNLSGGLLGGGQIGQRAWMKG